MKSERNKAYKKSQTIKNKPDNKEVTLLLSMVKENNIKLDKLDKGLNKIDEDINSNPFTKLFKVKGKTFIKYALILFVTILLMCGIYLVWVKLIYNWQFNLYITVEILGNGFYWIIAGIVYFGVDYLVLRKGWFNEYAKR